MFKLKEKKNKHIVFFLGVAAFFMPFLVALNMAAEKEYKLSSYSEEYNTYYFHISNLQNLKHGDTVLYVNKILPHSFVVELGKLKKSEKMSFIYNDVEEMFISKKNGQLILDGHSVCNYYDDNVKLSLYFVNGKMIVYLDDIKKFAKKFKIDKDKKIGVKLSKEQGFVCRNFNCYEPVPFSVADYGDVLENGIIENRKDVRTTPHNVGENYNLTFPTDVTCHSERSIKFEYRYENAKKSGVSKMQRGRSEISGVFSKSPKNKWILEFDFYVPTETEVDNEDYEIITQIHEGSTMPTTSSFCLFVRGGFLYCTIKGDSTDIEKWVRRGKPKHNQTYKLSRIKKETWCHIKCYIKEEWSVEDNPLTVIWVDGKMALKSDTPNSYYYKPRKEGLYSYLKFGIYKSAWLKKEYVKEKIRRRIYYFDNYVVKY